MNYLHEAITLLCGDNGAINCVQGDERPNELYSLLGPSTIEMCNKELNELLPEEREELVTGEISEAEEVRDRAPVTHSILNHLFTVM